KNRGTYLWVKVKDWSRWEERLIYGPYIHHVIGIHDKIAPVIYEATKYIDGVKFDSIEPSEKEINDWLMGRSNNI
ncbi:MAG: fucose isomerase, partial [Actinobacteria bacterium]|nr:fucose isomerase [Actinomycetota bacterium]